METYRQLPDKILYPISTSKDKDNLWVVYSYLENTGYVIIAENIKNKLKLRITGKPSFYSSIKSLYYDDKLWIVYTDLVDDKKCINLAVIENKKLIINTKITDLNKYDNPCLEIKESTLCIVWEYNNHGKCKLIYKDINYKQQNGKLEIEISDDYKVLTDNNENAYKPSLILNQNKLYCIYESFYSHRYHLMARVNYNNKWYGPFDIGLSSKNNQYASVCKFEESILVAWENSSPLEKGYRWEEPDGNAVTMPGFGHGWKVLTKICLSKIYFEGGNLYYSNLNDTENSIINIDNQESSGCPKVFVNSNHIYITYLKWVNNDICKGWGIETKYYNGTNWLEIKSPFLIQNQRVTPSVGIDEKQIYLLGSDVKNKSKVWTTISTDNKIYSYPLNVGKNDELVIQQFNEPKNCTKQEFIENIKVTQSINYKEKELNLYWGDLHMHTNISGCSLHEKFHCLEIEEKYRFCKDVANLDFAMVTDHDSMQFDEWDITRAVADFNNIPGKFTAFIGFEWTCTQKKNQHNYGHYNVLYKKDGEMYKTEVEGTKSIEEVWSLLNKNEAITIPHHPSEKIHPLDWEYFNEEFEPLVEIFQVRGSYESDNCYLKPENFGRSTIKNNSIQYGLNKGYKFGFTSGGEHEGVGVTAVYAEELTRNSIFDALKARHTYGTTGAHIKLDFRINDNLMGSDIEITKSPELKIGVIGTDNIKEIRVIRNGKLINKWNVNEKEFIIDWVDENLEQDSYYYITVLQNDDEMAWSSPIWVKQI